MLNKLGRSSTSKSLFTIEFSIEWTGEWVFNVQMRAFWCVQDSVACLVWRWFHWQWKTIYARYVSWERHREWERERDWSEVRWMLRFPLNSIKVTISFHWWYFPLIITKIYYSFNYQFKLCSFAHFRFMEQTQLVHLKEKSSFIYVLHCTIRCETNETFWSFQLFFVWRYSFSCHLVVIIYKFIGASLRAAYSSICALVYGAIVDKHHEVSFSRRFPFVSQQLSTNNWSVFICRFRSI